MRQSCPFHVHLHRNTPAYVVHLTCNSVSNVVNRPLRPAKRSPQNCDSDEPMKIARIDFKGTTEKISWAIKKLSHLQAG
ncbi:unnamed protein product [Dicrocoelium dendriticum]|nr:unnamed protein product [Dicrocoelium dendriticum]